MDQVKASAEQETRRRQLLTQRLADGGTLAEGLAHEVHNPLNCALLQLAVLQRRIEEPGCQPAALQPVAELVEQALRRLELLFSDFVSILQPRSAGRAPLAVGDRCAGVVTLVQADSDGAGMRVALDLVVELPPLDAKLRLVLANLWPASIELTAEDGKMVLRARPPDPAP